MINELAAEAVQVTADLTGVASHDCVFTLGPGWGGAVGLIGETAAKVPTERVSGSSANGVTERRGALRFIMPESGRTLVLGARTHFYEDKGVDAATHEVRTTTTTGARVYILASGYGSTVSERGPETVALIGDHINLIATPPLRGANFVDLTDLYSPWLREVTRGADPNLPEGVYAQLPGPHCETSAEMCMAEILGADLVGMSTVLKAIAARTAGMEVLGIFLVTNYAAGVAPSALGHGEVLEVGKVASPHISRLLADIVRIIDRAGSSVARPLAGAD